MEHPQANDRDGASADAASDAAALDAQHPWPGLRAFTEIDSGFFRGRARESEELQRLVRRERLTVLFGRSGLGKSSLLKAGLFPLLIDDGHLPVYLRIGYDADIGPRQQIWQALDEACRARRIDWVPPLPDETLWAFFHRARAGFWNARRRPVIPVLVFDQFEEIFTRGKATETTRAVSAEFMAELADLIEDRPSQALRAAFEANPALTATLDFERFGCRQVLSFREDFLPDVDALRTTMPAVTGNRYRLLPMRGHQAQEVIAAGGALVDGPGGPVSGALLGLAWQNRAETPAADQLHHIEVDPALLSVVCSELNLRRLKAGLPALTRELVMGAERDILADFYERSVQPHGEPVRRFIEDALITEAGLRDSRSFEDAAAMPGVGRAALDQLVQGRLLSRDERFGVRRIELTHDVLTRVVKASRDDRRVREAEQAALERESAAQRQQARNRRNALWVSAAFVGVLLLAGLTVFQFQQSRVFAALAQSNLSLARSGVLALEADALQDTAFDASLLVTLESIHQSPTAYATAGLLRRFDGRPHLLTHLAPHTEKPNGVAFSPDGHWVASAGRKASTGGGEVWLSNARTHRWVTRLEGQQDSAFSLAFTPDSRYLASTGKDGTVLIWDLTDPRSRAQPDVLYRHRDEAVSLAISPDGKWLASGDGQGGIKLWDMTLRSWRDLPDSPSRRATKGLAFSPDSKLLASAHASGQLLLWAIDKPSSPPQSIKDGRGELEEVAFSRDGLSLGVAETGDDEGFVVLWSRNPTGEFVHPRRIRISDRPVRRLVFSTDGRRLATAGDERSITLWDLATPQHTPERALVGSENRPGATMRTFSADTAARAGLIRRLTLEGHQNGVYRIAFSPDGNRLVTTGGDNRVVIWDLTRGNLWQPLTAPASAFPSLARTSAVSFDGSGKRLAAVGADQNGGGIAQVWQVETDSFRNRDRLGSSSIIWTGASKNANGMPFEALAFQLDGSRLAAGGKDRTVSQWTLKSQAEPLQRTVPGEVLSLAYRPDGKELAVGLFSPHAWVWPTDSLADPQGLGKHDGSINALAFGGDGGLLASADDSGKVYLWKRHNGQFKRDTLLGHKPLAPVMAVDFSHDGKQLASAGVDKSVKIWDVQGLRVKATLNAHTATINALSYRSDGDRLASGADDGIALWEMRQFRKLASLHPPDGRVVSLAFSPDGLTLVSGGGNVPLLWNLDVSALQRQACQAANRNLTCEEWRQYIGREIPYRAACPAHPAPAACPAP